MQANIIKITVLSALLFQSSFALAQEKQQAKPNYYEYISQRQVVDSLINDALIAFKSPSRVSDAGFTAKLPSNMEVVAQRLLIAFKLEPYRVDLLFSAASAYIYNKDIDKALDIYKQILTLAPQDQDALSYLVAWSRYQNNQESYQHYQQILKKLYPQRHLQMEEVFAVIDHTLKMPLTDNLNATDLEALSKLGSHAAITTLGYMLDPDGSMNPILIKRLEKTLELAQLLPDAIIIVTGGVPKSHQTEANLMAQWLQEKGIDAQRIYQDNYARSTVENALFSRYILTSKQIKQAVILSSGSHVRRAQALFTLACAQSGPDDISFIGIAVLDKPLAELQTATDSDIFGIYRDALKTFGLWSFRSYPLEER